MRKNQVQDLIFYQNIDSILIIIVYLIERWIHVRIMCSYVKEPGYSMSNKMIFLSSSNIT